MSESPRNIKELIGALRDLRGRVLSTEEKLYIDTREVFEKLQSLKLAKTSDFDINQIEKTIKILEALPEGVTEIEIKELGKELQMETKSLNKEDLDQLIEDYEKADKKTQKEIGREISKRTGKRNVDQFIKTQKEIEAKNAEKLNELSPELKEKVTQDLNRISENQPEMVSKIIEEASLKEELIKKDLEKEIKKSVKEAEKVEEIIQKIDEVRAEIKVETKAEEIAKTTYEKLKASELPVSEKVVQEIKERVLESWKIGEKLEIPTELKERGQEITIVEAIKEAEKFKTENLKTVVNYRAIELEKEIGQELRNNGVQDEALISEYVTVINKLTNNSETARMEEDGKEIYAYVERENPGKSPGEIERSIDEARFMAKNVVMAPNKFNNLIKKYNFLREKIGSDKLPKIKEVRVVEKMAALFKDSPKLLKLMNSAQRVVGTIEKITNFPSLVMNKFGGKLLEKAGGKILEKIGGEAAKVFVKEAAKTLAKEGLKQGVKTILGGLLTSGTAAGASGAAAGTVAGIIGGIAAIPGIGWIIAGVTLVLWGVKKLWNKLKDGLSSKLGINLNGVKSFISDTLGLGKFLGSIGQFTFEVGAFLVGIPALLTLMSFMSIITPVIIVFFVGILVYSMFQQNLISSIVPPADMGNCVLKSEISGVINCNQKAPENSVPGVNKSNFVEVANRWSAGKNYAQECYNDTVNKALCAGVNPAYALWAWLHESGASNYSLEDVEDFGIHGQSTAPPKNFNAQIKYFLKLDPGSACPELGYWLSFATNYLNGSCDPDEINPVSGISGRDYLKEMQETWSWISTLPMPAGIKTSPGGINCGQEDDEETTYPGNAHEVTDKDGNVWVCTENTQSPLGNYDPNSPGLEGVEVDGECSVGEVVVPTKQCDSQWGNVQLNGGSCSNGKPGTICSAGCGPTSVSMLMRRVNGSLTPNNVIFNPGSAYINMGCEGSSLDQAQSELGKKFGNSAITYDGVTMGCDEKAIAKWICGGKVVMVLADYYRNTKLEIGGHYVLAIGVKNGKIVVQDPYYSVTTTPFDGTKAYGYAHDIRGCLLIDKGAIK